MAKFYINNFKGRVNRRERAKHLRDEFDAIEAAFVSLQSAIATTYTTIHTYADPTTEVFEVNPENGLLQEVTLSQTTTIQVADPLETGSKLVSLLIHASNIRIINGWGPQTWKEKGESDWIHMNTGLGGVASMLIDFTWDGKTWIGIVAARNVITGETFPLIKDLVSVSGDETLVFDRPCHSATFDTNERLWLVSEDEPRFIGSRYVHNWVATPNDLQSVAWEETDAVVSTEAAAGPAGGDVDKITFSATGGEVGCWVLPEFARAATTADEIKFAVRFKAKMAAGDSGSFRAVVSLHGVTSGETVPCHEAITVTLDDEWTDYGYVFSSWQDGTSLHTIDSKRVLTKLSFKSPSGSTGSPILVTGVQIEVLREGYPEIPSELQECTLGASMVLVATSGSTGTWDDGTKVMSLYSGEFVDFQDSLEIGSTYLMDCAVTSGRGSDFIMGDSRMFWESGLTSDSKYVADAPFVFRYEGGECKWVLNGAASASYLVNVYLISDGQAVYGTEIGNTIDAATYELTEGTGVPVGSYFVQGAGVEHFTGQNLIDVDEYRSFNNWTRFGLVSGSDPEGAISSFRGEYGLDGFPCRGTLLQDTMTTEAGYIELTKTIPTDTNQYGFGLFYRRLFNEDGTQVIFPQGDNVISPASKYLDLVLTLTNGVTSTTSGRVRFYLPTALIVSSWPVDAITGVTLVNYQSWIRIGLALTNDGTFDEFTVRIYPAAGDEDGSATDDALTGYAIIDWASMDDQPFCSATIGGETRAAESISTALADGYLYNSNSDEIGDVTGGVWTFDVPSIWKNILWTDTPLAFDVNSMHEFGPPAFAPEVCDFTLDDEDDLPILDETGYEICAQEDVPAITLTLTKTVINTGGGTLTQDDFPVFVDGIPVDWDTAVEVTAGPHTASETEQPTYEASDWGGDCAADGTITLAAGDTKTGTITNTFQAGAPEVWMLTNYAGTLYYFHVDYTTGVSTLIKEQLIGTVATISGFATLGDQHILTCTDATARTLTVFSWDGSAFVAGVSRSAIGNNALNNFWTSPYYQGAYVAAGSGSYGGGVNYGTWDETAISAPTQYLPANLNTQDDLCDFRSAASGIGKYDGYGDWNVNPSNQGGSYDTSFWVASDGTHTPLDNNAPTYPLIVDYDRHTGTALTFSGGAPAYKYVNLTDGQITNGPLITGFVATINTYSVATVKGFILTHELDGYMRSYSDNGATATMIDQWDIGAYMNSFGHFTHDPFSDYIWIVANGGISPSEVAFRVNDDGTFNKSNIVTGVPVRWGGTFFMDSPLRCKRADEAVDWSYLTMDIAEASGDAWVEGDVIGIGENTCLHMVYLPDVIAGNMSGLVHRYPFGDDRELTVATATRKEANSDPDLWLDSYKQQANTAIGTKGVDYDFDTDGSTGRFIYYTDNGRAINRIQDGDYTSNSVQTYCIIEDLSSTYGGSIRFSIWYGATGDGWYTDMATDGSNWVVSINGTGPEVTTMPVTKARMYIYGDVTDKKHYFWEKDAVSPNISKGTNGAGGGGGQVFMRAAAGASGDGYLTIGDFSYGYMTAAL